MKTIFKKTFLKVVIISAFLAMVFAPAFALAEIKLELNYPSLPGIIDLASSTQSLQMAVRYYVQLGVIIAILVCIISLVWAGVSYISSTGQPGAMKQARERIFNTFIGLTILIGSFIILRTISPQMSLLSIVKPSIPTGGIVLLSKDGYNQLKDGKGFGDLVELGLIKPISGDMADLPKELGGQLKEIIYKDASGNPEPKEWNYPSFRLYAIGFWGEASMLYEVTLFKDAQFVPIQGATPVLGADPVKFTYAGSLLPDGTQTTDADTAHYFKGEEIGLTDKIKIFVINGLNHGGGTVASRNQAMWYPVGHPPQSIRIVNLKVGTYTVDENGTETLVSGDNPDAVDKNAAGLDMKNTVILPNGQVQKRDGLYIASDDSHARGNRAIYFQYRTSAQLQNVIPKLYFSNFFQEQDKFSLIKYGELAQAPDNVIEIIEEKNTDPNDVNLGKYPAKFKFTYYKDMDVNQFLATYGKKGAGKGFLPFGPSETVDYPYDGIYGAIKEKEAGKPSPQKGYDETDMGANVNVCQEVTVCKQNGHCLKFVPEGTIVQIDGTYTHYLPMPFFRPINLPNEITSIRVKEDGVAVSFPDDFNDQIVKVKIKGKCWVVLFENHINFLTSNSTQFQGFKALGRPANYYLTGDKSVIVTNTQYDESTGDLKGTVAMQCPKFGIDQNNFSALFGRGEGSCPSAIAVFPVK